jgi:hypothetical protein
MCTDIRKLFQIRSRIRLLFQELISAPDALWAGFLPTIAKGQIHDIQDWRDLRQRYGLTATRPSSVSVCGGMILSSVDFCYEQARDHADPELQ